MHCFSLINYDCSYTYVADWNVSLQKGEPHEVKDHSVENFLKQLNETEEFIGEYVNLYQIHSATFESGVLTNKQVHEALGKCKKEKGWQLGLSVSSPKQGETIREALQIQNPYSSSSGERLFDSVQCTYNLLEQSAANVLMEAHDAGVDVVIKEGLANGRVLNNQHVVEASAKLGVLPDQLALACILAQPFSPRVLSGAVTNAHLESNANALKLYPTLQPGGENSDVLKELMSKCAMHSDDYWSERAALAWN
jgi:aryl-alcohol dehydrogenase-like predicted oxidoreductase